MTNWDAILKAAEEKHEEERRATYLALTQGFTFRVHGRHGQIFFREGDYIVEIPWEMSGIEDYQILMTPLVITRWTQPVGVPIESAKQDQIRNDLEAWLESKDIKTDAFAPLKRPLFPDG